MKLFQGSEEGFRYRLEAIGLAYTDRMRNNMSMSGSYFANDPFIKNDLSLCRTLHDNIKRKLTKPTY